MIKDPFFRNHLIRDAIYAAIEEKIRADDRVYLLGEGAHMKVHFDAPSIKREFPDRCLTLPISEDANTNFALGLAIAGLIPIVDVISSDFLFRTMDAICNTCAKHGAVTGDPKTIIVRAEFLTGGPTTGQRIESLFAAVPGLNVVVPSNPLDAYVLMRTALQTKAVTVFFEDRTIADDEETAANWLVFHEAMKSAAVSSSGARVRRRPAVTRPSLTIVTYGLATRIVDGLPIGDAEHIDLRTLWPLDVNKVYQSLYEQEYQDPGPHLLVVEPCSSFLGIGAELVAQVVERFSGGLLVRRLGGPRSVIPASRDLHDRLVPTPEQIMQAIKELTS